MIFFYIIILYKAPHFCTLQNYGKQSEVLLSILVA